MANPNIWVPGASLDAKSSVRFESFTSAIEQSTYTLTSFSYIPGTGSLIVFISGIAQRPGIDFIETSPTSFTLTSPLPAGVVILALGFTEVSGNIVPADFSTEEYTATGGETTVTRTEKPSSYTNSTLMVYRNGLLQRSGYDYTVTSSTEILLDTAAEEGEVYTQITYLTTAIA